MIDSATLLTSATVPWGDARLLRDGLLTAIVSSTAFDWRLYARRDAELGHRDLVVAANVVKVATVVATVWGFKPPRPTVQGRVGDLDLDNVAADRSAVLSGSGVVTHVNPSDVPDAGVSTDKDLYSRDLILFEALARAAEILADPDDSNSSPPIARIDPGATLLPTIDTAWSEAVGRDNMITPGSAHKLGVDLLREPDRWLAYRDNLVAYFVAWLEQVLKNPLEHASRLYLRVASTDVDKNFEAEVYGLVSETALTRVFQAEPRIEGRGLLTYDRVQGTVSWSSWAGNVVHVPVSQPFGLSPAAVTVAGPNGETLTFVPIAPEIKDAAFYAQKSRVINPRVVTTVSEGVLRTVANHHVASGGGFLHSKSVTIPRPGQATRLRLARSLEAIVHDTTTATVTLTDHGLSVGQKITVAGVTVAGGSPPASTYNGGYVVASVPTTYQFTYEMGADPLANGDDDTGTVAPRLLSGEQHNVYALLRPMSEVEFYGSQGVGGTDGDDNVVTFDTAGDMVSWGGITLPIGSWTLEITYTNGSGTVPSRFPCVISLDGMDDVIVNLRFGVDDLENGELAKITVPVQATGEPQDLIITWTPDSAGSVFQINLVSFKSAAVSAVDMDVECRLIGDTGAVIGDMAMSRAFGIRNRSDVLCFKIDVDATVTDPVIDLRWAENNDFLSDFVLTIDELELVYSTANTPTPNVVGLNRFREEMLFRAMGSIQANYGLRVGQLTDLEFGELLSDGTFQWTSYSTQQWLDQLAREELRLSTAFRPAGPADVGRPALVPTGLELVTTAVGQFKAGDVKRHYSASLSRPVITPLQAWMVGLGFYVAVESFWDEN